jgi:hypothetical protein
MRQPTPEEVADGDSAARLAREAVLADSRLRELARNEDAHRREADIRATAARVIYLLPLLLQDDDGQPAFNVHDAGSMADFEALEPAILTEMIKIYWGPITEAMVEAKKKSRLPSSAKSKSARDLSNGHSPRQPSI